MNLLKVLCGNLCDFYKSPATVSRIYVLLKIEDSNVESDMDCGGPVHDISEREKYKQTS